MLATERPRGVFSRQLVLGDNLDTERIQASLPGGRTAVTDTGGRAGQAPQDRDRPRRSRARIRKKRVIDA